MERFPIKPGSNLLLSVPAIVELSAATTVLFHPRTLSVPLPGQWGRQGFFCVSTSHTHTHPLVLLTTEGGRKEIGGRGEREEGKGWVRGGGREREGKGEGGRRGGGKGREVRR